MIKSSALSELLQKAISHGIDTIFISKNSGEILSIEGKESNQTITDVVSSMWASYYQLAKMFNENELEYLIIENEDSNIITTNLYGYIIAAKAGIKMQLGMLKCHLESVANYLNKTFEPYSTLIKTRSEK